jgi:hypothetical protein
MHGSKKKKRTKSSRKRRFFAQARGIPQVTLSSGFEDPSGLWQFHDALCFYDSDIARNRLTFPAGTSNPIEISPDLRLLLLTSILIPSVRSSELTSPLIAALRSRALLKYLYSGFVDLIRDSGRGLRRRYSKAHSPELPGRIVFFVVAVGRSPPA